MELLVFKKYPEDPIKNPTTVCDIQKDFTQIREAGYLNYDPDRAKPTAGCNHTVEHDDALEHHYKMQLWHLNFLQYLTMLLMNAQIVADQAGLNALEDY